MVSKWSASAHNNIIILCTIASRKVKIVSLDTEALITSTSSGPVYYTQ